MKNGSALIQCACEHDFQDKKYGKHTRVANATAKQDQTRAQVRCTVCSKVVDVPLNKVR